MTGAPQNIQAEQSVSEDHQMSEAVSQNSTARMLPELSSSGEHCLPSNPATLEETIRPIKGCGVDDAIFSGMFDEAILALGKIDAANIVRGKRRGRGAGRKVNGQTADVKMEMDGESKRGGESLRRQSGPGRKARKPRYAPTQYGTDEERAQWAAEKQAKEESFALETAMEKMESMTFDANASQNPTEKSKPVDSVSSGPHPFPTFVAFQYMESKLTQSHRLD